MRPLVLALALLSLLPLSSALPADPPDDLLTDVPTRPDVTVPVYLMRRRDAVATVALLPGGAGNITLKKGFTIAVVGRPGDIRGLSFARRRTADHLEDVRMVVKFLQRETSLPVWLVGTSRGSSNGQEHHKGRQTRPSPDPSGEGKCCSTRTGAEREPAMHACADLGTGAQKKYHGALVEPPPAGAGGSPQQRDLPRHPAFLPRREPGDSMSQGLTRLLRRRSDKEEEQ